MYTLGVLPSENRVCQNITTINMKPVCNATEALPNHESLKPLQVAYHTPEEASEADVLSGSEIWTHRISSGPHRAGSLPAGICTAKMFAAYGTRCLRHPIPRRSYKVLWADSPISTPTSSPSHSPQLHFSISDESLGSSAEPPSLLAFLRSYVSILEMICFPLLRQYWFRDSLVLMERR